MSAGALAKKLNVPCTRIERIAAEQILIIADTALRLADNFRTTPEFWMNMQTSFNLKTEKIELNGQPELILEWAGSDRWYNPADCPIRGHEVECR